MRNLTAHTNAVNAIESLSDGTIVSGGADYKVLVWNLTSGANLTSFSPLNTGIYVIKEISPQVIAVGGTSNTMVFYRVNGSMTPVLLKSTTLPSNIYYTFGMVVSTVYYGSSNWSMLYVSSYASYAVVFNITDLSNITPIQIDAVGNSLYAIEKSGIKLFYTVCLSVCLINI